MPAAVHGVLLGDLPLGADGRGVGVARDGVVDLGDDEEVGVVDGVQVGCFPDLYAALAGNPPDQVITNTVPGAPLSGTEPLIAALGLPPIFETTQSANGVRGAVRFTEGDHGSLLSPAASLAATVEMQGQMASLIASDGTVVLVQDTSVIRTQ